MFNHTKTECLYFPIKDLVLKVLFSINMQLLRWITKYKCIRAILTDHLSDDSNMLR